MIEIKRTQASTRNVFLTSDPGANLRIEMFPHEMFSVGAAYPEKPVLVLSKKHLRTLKHLISAALHEDPVYALTVETVKVLDE